jgi:hypothetical protein
MALRDWKGLRAKAFADNTNSENSHRTVQFCTTAKAGDIRL